MSTGPDRALGLLGVLGGGSLLIGLLPIDLPWTPDAFNLRLVLSGIGAMAVVIGMQRRHVSAAPALAWAAAAPCLIAHGLYSVLVVGAVSSPGQIGPGDFGPWFHAVAVAMWLADSWFGVVTVRLGVAHRWGGLALAVGSPLALTGMSRLGLVDGPLAAVVVPLALAGVALNGVGWILLGLHLMRQVDPVRSGSAVDGMPSA